MNSDLIFNILKDIKNVKDLNDFYELEKKYEEICNLMFYADLKRILDEDLIYNISINKKGEGHYKIIGAGVPKLTEKGEQYIENYKLNK